MQEAISLRDLFFHSTTLFYCGVYGIVCCNCIPTSKQRCWTFMFTYSPPLSLWRILIFLMDWFSASSLKSLRCSKTLHFCLRKYTKVYHEKSSRNVITYLALLMDIWGKGPIKSLWMSSKGEEALLAFPFSNFSWGCLLRTHPQQALLHVLELCTWSLTSTSRYC